MPYLGLNSQECVPILCTFAAEHTTGRNWLSLTWLTSVNRSQEYQRKILVMQSQRWFLLKNVVESFAHGGRHTSGRTCFFERFTLYQKKRTVLEHIFGNAIFLYDSYPKMCCSSFACGGQTHCRQEFASFDVGWPTSKAVGSTSSKVWGKHISTMTLTQECVSSSNVVAWKVDFEDPFTLDPELRARTCTCQEFDSWILWSFIQSSNYWCADNSPKLSSLSVCKWPCSKSEIWTGIDINWRREFMTSERIHESSLAWAP